MTIDASQRFFEALLDPRPPDAVPEAIPEVALTLQLLVGQLVDVADEMRAEPVVTIIPGLRLSDRDPWEIAELDEHHQPLGGRERVLVTGIMHKDPPTDEVPRIETRWLSLPANPTFEDLRKRYLQVFGTLPVPMDEVSPDNEGRSGAAADDVIDEEAARLLLTRAFAQKIVDGIFEPGIRALVSECVDDALARLEERST